MNLPSVLEALDDGSFGDPAVLLRLRLMVADGASGPPKVVSSLMKKISMPPLLASPNVSIALEIQGERRVFKPTQVTWDETYRVCIVEVEWLVAHADEANELENAELWPA